ncbi:cytochrome c oxidase subunit II [Arenibaculum sp.]|uniref:cytochrome c oxidase subunit II n=1 Tax=Arenibaculum sp. TaxID=2865862 RepID=UPI002E0E9D66|nr:cytochrome c oxidase subunit II [Arenibaculum sp.]
MPRCRYLPLLPLALAACSGDQSVLRPRSPEADAIETLSMVLFTGGAVIFVAVMGLVLYALFADPDRTRRLTGDHLVLWGGLVFPAVTLAILLVYSISVSNAVTRPPAQDALRVEVIGHMWWWEVRYLDESGELEFVTANEIRAPVGRPVEVALTTADVIHSFWVPNLHGKMDLIPGHVNRIVFTPREAGVMRGQCAEFCGDQHAWMAFHFVAHEPAEFEEWLELQRRPAPEPPTPMLAAGREAFVAYGCGACHRVRGLEGADGDLGPDLTHVGSRPSIAAGRLDNTVGAFGGWIVSAQHLKPDNFMPSFEHLDGPTLRALAAWLESLE